MDFNAHTILQQQISFSYSHVIVHHIIALHLVPYKFPWPMGGFSNIEHEVIKFSSYMQTLF